MKGWIARDKSGDLYLYTVKPCKDADFDMWVLDEVTATPMLLLDRTDFPEVTWDDSEPTEAELTIQIKR